MRRLASARPIEALRTSAAASRHTRKRGSRVCMAASASQMSACLPSDWSWQRGTNHATHAASPDSCVLFKPESNTSDLHTHHIVPNASCLESALLHRHVNHDRMSAKRAAHTHTPVKDRGHELAQRCSHVRVLTHAGRQSRHPGNEAQQGAGAGVR